MVTAVMIGIDPHKGSHTATALDATEHELAGLKVRAGRPCEQLLGLAAPGPHSQPGQLRLGRVQRAGGVRSLVRVDTDHHCRHVILFRVDGDNRGGHS